jgi:CheY-like chemotaxis protein
MMPRRVVVASPDPALIERVSSILSDAGHRVVRSCESPFEALDACLEATVDLAVLDQELPSITGAHIAAILGDLGSRVATVVLHRGDPSILPREVSVLDPDRESFPAALLALAAERTSRRSVG